MEDMTDRTGRDEQPEEDPATPGPFERFEKLARRLVSVPKREIKEAEERERDQRRPA